MTNTKVYFQEQQTLRLRSVQATNNKQQTTNNEQQTTNNKQQTTNKTFPCS